MKFLKGNYIPIICLLISIIVMIVVDVNSPFWLKIVLTCISAINLSISITYSIYLITRKKNKKEVGATTTNQSPTSTNSTDTHKEED